MLNLNPNLSSKSPTCNRPSSSPSPLSYATVLRKQPKCVRTTFNDSKVDSETKCNKNAVDSNTKYNNDASCQGIKNILQKILSKKFKSPRASVGASTAVPDFEIVRRHKMSPGRMLDTCRTQNLETCTRTQLETCTWIQLLAYHLVHQQVHKQVHVHIHLHVHLHLHLHVHLHVHHQQVYQAD